MGVVRSLTFCGTLLLVFLSLSTQLDYALGQNDEEPVVGDSIDTAASETVVILSSTSVSSDDDGNDHNQQPQEDQHSRESEEENQVVDQDPNDATVIEDDKHEACPCVTRLECPRIYGTDPMDFTTLGQLPPCKQSGFVRCCGVSVSVVQNSDESEESIVEHTVEVEDKTATTVSWTLEHQAHSEENSSPEGDVHHEISSSDENDGSHDKESQVHGDSQLRNDNEEHEHQPKSMHEDNNEDIISEESRQSLQIVKVEPPPSLSSSSVLRKKFQPGSKYPRYGGRPADVEPVSTYDSSSQSSSGSTDNGNIDGSGNERRKTFLPKSPRAPKFQRPSSTMYSTTPVSDEGAPASTDGGGGSVVYSQRASPIFSPSRSRKNSYNKYNSNYNRGSDNPVTTPTTTTSTAEINVETPVAEEIEHPVQTDAKPGRRRRPFNHMKNRQNQQHQQIVEPVTPPLEEIKQVSISEQLPPAQPYAEPIPDVVHISIQSQQLPEEVSAPLPSLDLLQPVEPVRINQDELDSSHDQRTPMSRVVKQRVNGLTGKGRRRKQKLGAGSGTNLEPSNNVGLSHLADENGSPGEPSGTPTQPHLTTLDDIGHGGVGGTSPIEQLDPPVKNEDENSKVPSGVKQDSYENSPNGQLMPLQPQLQPFNRNSAQGWSAPLEEINGVGGLHLESNVGGSGEEMVINKYAENKAVDEERIPLTHTPVINDLIEAVEQPANNNRAGNIRRVPIKRVKQQQPEVNQGGDGGKDNIQVSVPHATSSSPVRGRVVMRRPIKMPVNNGGEGESGDVQQPEINNQGGGDGGEDNTRVSVPPSTSSSPIRGRVVMRRPIKMPGNEGGAGGIGESGDGQQPEIINQAGGDGGEDSTRVSVPHATSSSPIRGRVVMRRPIKMPGNNGGTGGSGDGQQPEIINLAGGDGGEDNTRVSVPHATNSSPIRGRVVMRRPIKMPGNNGGAGGEGESGDVQQPDINNHGGVDGGEDNTRVSVPPATSSSSIRGRVVMRRPIKMPGNNGGAGGIGESGDGQPGQAGLVESHQPHIPIDPQVPIVVEGESMTDGESVQKTEKLDVRARLRARPRPNLLKSSPAATITDSMPENIPNIESTADNVESHGGNGGTSSGFSSAPSLLNPLEISRSPLLRKRVRPAILRRGQGKPDETGSEGDGGLNENAPSEPASPSLPDLVDKPVEQQTVERPSVLQRMNKLRKGGSTLSRLPLTRHHQNPNLQNPVDGQIKENESGGDAENQKIDAVPVVPASSLLTRQRQTRIRGRGQTRLPAASAGESGDAASTDSTKEDTTANIATSEAPITVTSTYSRIRTNSNKNSLLTKPMYRRPTYVAPTTPSPPSAALISPEELAIPSNPPPRTTGSRFGQKSRFPVSSKTDSSQTITTEIPIATVSINIGDSEGGAAIEIEKQGQSPQLSEETNSDLPTVSAAPEEHSPGGDGGRGGKRKGVYVRRKKVRVTQRPHQQSEQPLDIPGDGIPGTYSTYEETNINPGTTPENSVHVLAPSQPLVPPSILPVSVESELDQDVTYQVPPHVAETYPTTYEHASYPNMPVNIPNVHVKIVPEVGAVHGQDGTVGTEETISKNNEANYDHGSKYAAEADDVSINNNGGGDYGSTYDIDSSTVYESNEKTSSDDGAHPPPHPSPRVTENGEAYDLILNQDTRKTLGTHQYTHHSQNPIPEQLAAYQSPSPSPSPPETVEQDAYLLNHPHNGQNNNNNSPQSHQPRIRVQQQAHHPQSPQQQGDYYGSYYPDESSNKYAAGDVATYSHSSGGNSDFETQEMRSPDYDENSSTEGEDYWQEDEEESRVHVKYVKNKSSPSSSLSSQSIESSASWNENSNNNNYNEDTNKSPSYFYSQSPVNPSLASVHSIDRQSATSKEAIRTAADADTKRERNKRIRQQLRRPQSAYINSSMDSTLSNDLQKEQQPQPTRQRQRGHSAYSRTPSTAAPFTPSLRSPRPTYSGQEALLESVHQSAAAIKSAEVEVNPNSHQLEQFIEQKNKQQQIVPTTVAPITRTRSPGRVKLVTFKTTTPAPVVAPDVSNNYEEDHTYGNDDSDGSTPDASSSTVNEVRKAASTTVKFTFPPFRKSELPLITSDGSIEPTQKPVAYNDLKQVIFKPVASTSAYSRLPPNPTTTTTPAPTTPLRNYNYQDHSGTGSASVLKPSNSRGVPGKTRYKLNGVNKPTPANQVSHPSSSYESPVSYAPPASSIEPIKPAVSVPSSSYAFPLASSTTVPTTKKPQPRIKTPQLHGRFPPVMTTTTTTIAPVLIRHQIPVAVSTPPTHYSAMTYDNNQSQRQTHPSIYQKPMLEHQPLQEAAYEDDEQNAISIRITSDDSSSATIYDQNEDENLLVPPSKQQHHYQKQQHYPESNIHQQQHHQQQQFFKPENVIQEEPQPLYSRIPSAPPPSLPPVSPTDASVAKYNGKKNPGKQSNNRFKVPNKFEMETSHDNNIDSGDVRNSYTKPTFVVEKEPQMSVQTIPLPPPPPPQQHQIVHYNGNQQQPSVNGLYGNHDVIYDEPIRPPYQQQHQYAHSPVVVQARPEPEEFEEEEEREVVVPDIRINVLPPQQQQQYEHEQVNNYNDDRIVPPMNRAPVLHAIREQLPSPHQEQMTSPLQREHNKPSSVLKVSPFGPFPSTDHWSGIPSSNSPRLPEYFEERNKLSSSPLPEKSPSFEHEYSHEFRRPLPPPSSHALHSYEQEKPLIQQLPPRPLLENTETHFVNEDFEQFDNQGPPSSVQPMAIKFGTDFEEPTKHEEEVRIQSPQRPMIDSIPVVSNRFPDRLPPLSLPHSQSHLPPTANNVEFIKPIGGQHQMLGNNNPFPSMPLMHEQQPKQQLINIHQQTPYQEPPMHEHPLNSEVAHAMPNQFGDDERVAPYAPVQNFNDFPINKPPSFHPQLNQQLPPVSPPQQLPVHLPGNLPPSPTILFENGLKQEQLHETAQLPAGFSQIHSTPSSPEQNSNFVVQVDGMPHDAPVSVIMNQLPSAHTPLEQQPVKNHVMLKIEGESEVKPMIQPPSKLPNPPSFIPEGQHNIRDHVHTQRHPPAQQTILHPPKKEGGTRFKFPDNIFKGLGEQNPHSKPGHYGPPPPEQQRTPLYVPFSPIPSDLKSIRNETTPSGTQLPNHRPPVLPPSPQSFQNPFKFNNGQVSPSSSLQSNPSFSAPMPHRQNFNGNYLNAPMPNQPYNPHHRPQQLPMPGMRTPPGQYAGNNPYHYSLPSHHSRMRTPGGMRTSRAANLTAEEEKDERDLIAAGRADTSAPTSTFLDEAQTSHESFPDAPVEQQAALPLLSQADKLDQSPPAQKENNETVVEFIINPLNMVEVGGQRQQRELKFTKDLDNGRDTVAAMPLKTDDHEKETTSEIARTSHINWENFVQDPLPEDDESLEPSPAGSAVVTKTITDIANLYHIIPASDLKILAAQEDSSENFRETQGDNFSSSSAVMKPGKHKKLLPEQVFQHHQNNKAKLEQTGKEQQQKSIMKMKSESVKDKNEKQQTKGSNSGKKDQDEIKNENEQHQNAAATTTTAQSAEEIQQEFVAPKVVQRGFYPILPYSEEDPGPILVPMTPPVVASALTSNKIVEKFLPPFAIPVTVDSTITRVENNINNGAISMLLPPPPAALAAASGTLPIFAGKPGPVSSPPSMMAMMLGPGKINHDPMQFHNNINKHLVNGNIPVVMTQPKVIPNPIINTKNNSNSNIINNTNNNDNNNNNAAAPTVFRSLPNNH